MSDEQRAVALYTWRFWARPPQLAPTHRPWTTWLQMSGRGWGKTRSGGEWIRERLADGAKRIALVAKTPADARDVMVEGESGLLAISPPWDKPLYEPSKRRLTWPSGAIATIYSGADPDQLRGPQHDTAWSDELASWQYPRETWDNLQMGLRLGEDPRGTVTTTPKPISLLRELLADQNVVVTGGSTYENAANLPAKFFREIIAKYEGTSIGEQELYARLLTESPGALWKRTTLDASRITPEQCPPLRRIVVAIDPAATSNAESSETGILVCGIADNGHGYVLRDLSGRISPDAWARRAVDAYTELQADRIIGEQNNGGEMVQHTIRTVDPQVSYRAVHASKGKHTRGEPVAALYEQGRVHHVGAFPALEDQQCTWVPGEDSPDRMDALVWGLSELMLGPQVPSDVVPISLTAPSKWTGGGQTVDETGGYRPKTHDQALDDPWTMPTNPSKWSPMR